MAQTGRDPARLRAMVDALLGAAPGAGDVMAAQDSQRAGQVMAQALAGGDYGRAASSGLESLVHALGALPMVPALAGVMKRAGDLPMDQASRMARAREQGFDVDRRLYHATDADIHEFDLGAAGTGANVGNQRERAVFLTDSPDVADTYLGGAYVNTKSPDVQAKSGMQPETHGEIARYYNKGSNVVPAFVRGADNFDVWDMGGGGYHSEDMAAMIREARKGGAKGLVLENVRDPGLMNLGRGKPSTVYAVFDPKDIRSAFAKFAPGAKGKKILGSVAGATILVASMVDEEAPE